MHSSSGECSSGQLRGSFPSRLPSTVAFLAPFMVHSCPQLKRLGTGSSFPTGSEELKLCRGGLGAEYLSISAGAETSPLGFGQERGFGSLFGAGEALSLPVAGSSAARDGTPGLRAALLWAALSHGLRNRKGNWREAELSTLPCWTEILSLLLLALCSRDGVRHSMQQLMPVARGRRGAGWGWWGGRGWQDRAPAPAAAPGQQRQRWDSASVAFQQGLGQGEGYRVRLTCCCLIYVNKAEERQTEPAGVRRARPRPPFRSFPCRRRCRPGEGAGAARTVPARGGLAPRRLRATYRRRGEPGPRQRAGAEAEPGAGRASGRLGAAAVAGRSRRRCRRPRGGSRPARAGRGGVGRAAARPLAVWHGAERPSATAER